MLSISFRLHNTEATISSWISSLLFPANALTCYISPSHPGSLFAFSDPWQCVYFSFSGETVPGFVALCVRTAKNPLQALLHLLWPCLILLWGFWLAAICSSSAEGSICHPLPSHSTQLLSHSTVAQRQMFGFIPWWHVQHPAQHRGGGGQGLFSVTVQE